MENTLKLTSNEEKVRKKLAKFPQGVKVRTLKRELYMGKTAVYKALNGLEVKELAFRGGHGLWLPNLPLNHQDSEARNKRLGFFGWWEQRAERKRMERRAEDEEYDRQTWIIKARRELLAMKQEYKRTRPRVDKNKSIPLAIVFEMEQKIRQHYGLSETDPL